jgi:hypothetical protein
MACFDKALTPLDTNRLLGRRFLDLQAFVGTNIGNDGLSQHCGINTFA